MKCYLIDLDGTLYRGDQAIEHAVEFIEWLNKSGRRYLLLTNCPLNTPKAISDKLTSMGMKVTADRVLTSSVATVDYLQKNYSGKRVFLLGSNSFRQILMDRGIDLCDQGADVVVVGFDPEMHYSELAKACQEVLIGAELLASNMDNVIPKDHSFIPHTGSIVQAISFATGVNPVVVGKPMRHMLDSATKLLSCSSHDCIMIGDRLDTDMRFALNNKLQGYLVLTGYTNKQMLDQSDLIGVDVFKNLAEVICKEDRGREI